MRNKNSENLAMAAIGVFLVILLFMWLIMMSSCNSSKPQKYCPTLEYNGKSVICLGNDCDTVQTYYYNECSNCITYEYKSLWVFICGRFTRTALDSIKIKNIE